MAAGSSTCGTKTLCTRRWLARLARRIGGSRCALGECWTGTHTRTESTRLRRVPTPIFDTLWDVADRARAGGRLSSSDITFVRRVAPAALDAFPRLTLPKSIRHPAGFSVAGAPVGTFLRSALLLSAQRALGRRFAASACYDTVEKDLAFGIMRSYFHHAYPKGTHCCVQCTLAVYPVLEAGAIRYFDCGPLSRDVRRVITDRQWRFASPANPKMLRWSLDLNRTS